MNAQQLKTNQMRRDKKTIDEATEAITAGGVMPSIMEDICEQLEIALLGKEAWCRVVTTLEEMKDQQGGGL